MCVAKKGREKFRDAGGVHVENFTLRGCCKCIDPSLESVLRSKADWAIRMTSGVGDAVR